MIAPRSCSPLLQLNSLVVGYAGRGLNEPFSATLSCGALVSVLGANGSGKSTLLRTLAGELPAVSGQVVAFGRDVADFSPRALARVMAIVTTHRIDASSLSVREVVEMGRYPHTGRWGSMAPTDRRVVAEAMEFVGVRGLEDRNISDLSDGERQKTMVARALAQDTPIVLLDEPTSYLDVASRIELMALLHRLACERNILVILSTHDVTSALEHSSLLWLVMPDGRVVQSQPESLVAEARVGQGALCSLFSNRNVSFSADRLNFISKSSD